ncbi:MAG: hypothetical protein O7D94_04995 [Planctomycetota bacterium]|nr:hypothetical protein [Planctomycetota bacterium]
MGMPVFVVIFTLVFAIFALRSITRSFRRNQSLQERRRNDAFGDDSWGSVPNAWVCRRCRSPNYPHGRFCRFCGKERA